MYLSFCGFGAHRNACCTLQQLSAVLKNAPKRQCIAYSGVVPELLPKHDPSRSCLRVYFKQLSAADVELWYALEWYALELGLNQSSHS